MAPGGQRREGRSSTVASIVGSGVSQTPHVRVLVADELGRRVPAPGLARWLARVAPARARGTVSVALVSDARVRELNRRYRRIDRQTDVLSFPTEGFSSGPRGPTSLTAPGPHPQRLALAAGASRIPGPLLGDIVIARGVARRQAREAGHSELTELRVLALHGLLHLLGYDHDRDSGRMRRVERRLWHKGGLREGLIERAHRVRRSVLDTPDRDGAAPAALASAGARAKKMSSGAGLGPRASK